MIEGRVISARNSIYDVQTETSILRCQIRGSLKQKLRSEKGQIIYADPIAVGDRVLVSPMPDAEGAIEDLLPRQTKLSRRDANKNREIEQIIVANADQVIIVGSVRSPRLNFRFIDRFLILAETGGLSAIVCINKIDLIKKKDFDRLDEIRQTYESIGYRTIYTSIHKPKTIENLKEILKGKFSVIVGASGVGKSSLLNAIQPELGLKVGDVGEKTNKGRHTTTLVKPFQLDLGGEVADTPGVREVGLWGVDTEFLDHYFPEMEDRLGECKFNNCKHIHEPNCVVRSAVESGEIASFRYESYIALLEDH